MSRSHSQKQPKPDLDALAEKLRALTRPQCEEIPEGFHPVEFWAKTLRQDPSNAYVSLKAGVDAGMLEMQRFRRVEGKPRVKHWKQL